MKKQKGITLIALIITVVVLLILAAVTINEIQGNGIIEHARTARENYNKSKIVEEIALEIFNKKLENLGTINEAEFEEILAKYGTISEDEAVLTTTEGNYQILISDIYDGELDKYLVTTPLSSWEYKLSGSDIILTKYIGEDSSIFVPNTFFIEGVSYATKLNGTYNRSEIPFYKNKVVTEIKFGDTVSVVDNLGYALFYECTNLKTVYNIPAVTDASYIFAICQRIENIPSIPDGVTNLQGAFSQCFELKSPIVIEAEGVTNADYCFNNIGHSDSNPIILRVNKDSTTYQTLKTVIDNSNYQYVYFEGEEPPVRLACWGDSLTAASYTTKLKELLGNKASVFRVGVGGEDSKGIAARQGAVPIYTNGFTIPITTTESVEIEIKDTYGKSVTLARQGTAGLNPCYINGTEGNITYNSSTSKYYFTRSAAGKETAVQANTQIITDGMQNYRDHLMIIWAGTNDRPNSTTVQNVINNINSMIEYSNNPNYIVIGLTSKAYMSDIVAVNEKLAEEYGDHFLDIRTYILENGLTDAGIEATGQDTADIADGEIPTSLRKDRIHLTDSGYEIVAQQVYNKLISLGYISE